MNELAIHLMECNFNGSYQGVPQPEWQSIETAIRQLEQGPGQIHLFEGNDDGFTLMIAGSPGSYSVDVMIGDSRAAMLVNKVRLEGAVVEVFGEEYRADQVVHDIATVVATIQALIQSREFVAPDNLEWEFRDI